MKIEYVRMYDKNNVLIKSWETDFTVSSTKVTYSLYQVPSNTYKVIYKVEIGGNSYTYTKYADGCSTSQYFYFDNEYVNTLYCFGKKEDAINIEKQKIKGKKVNVVKTKIQEKVVQHTGLNLNENELFSIASSPFIFTISGTTVKNYLLDNNAMQGYNTISFGSKDIVLNLTGTQDKELYNSIENNFYR